VNNNPNLKNIIQFNSGYTDPRSARIEADAAAAMTDQARPLIFEKTSKEFPAFANPEKAGEMVRCINREQKMFKTMNEALGVSKTINNWLMRQKWETLTLRLSLS
jgi:hypothetical protein